MKSLNRVLLVLLVFFSITLPVFADTTSDTGADLLLKYGFITGDNGDPMITKSLTRAEVAVIMTELNGTKEIASRYTGPTGFSDVESNKWYSPYIAYAKANNLLAGYPDGTFKPNSEVTSREFAAFLMNAMGYKNEYSFNDVLSFAADRNIRVEVSGVTFVRGDAFEALWAAVNQPVKGGTTPIGVTLGKIPPTEIASPKNEVIESTVITEKSLQITFKSPIANTSNIQFLVKRDSNAVNLGVNWNSSKTVATLSSPLPLNIGTYTINIQDGGDVNYGPYFVKVENQKIANVEIDSAMIERYNEYAGTIGYTVYDQYGENITNTPLGKNVSFVVTTDHPQAIKDSENGTVLIQQGTYPQTLNTLRTTDFVRLIVVDDTSGYSTTKDLTISPGTTAISDVRINGIVNEYNNFVDLIYIPGKDYYLDITILNSHGRTVNAKEIFAEKGPTGQDILLVQSLNPSVCDIVKTVNPVYPNRVAYKLVFTSVPTTSMPLSFYVNSLNSITATSKASFTATLIVQ